jgi:hypothetical protein
MITGRRSAFLARCRERGYTLDEVRGCIISEDGESITVDETSQFYPRTARPPSMLQKARNFAAAAVQHAAAGMPMCSEDEISRRYSICQGCEHLRDGACTKCGCPVVRKKAYLSKLSWADQSCPIGKWGPASG